MCEFKKSFIQDTHLQFFLKVNFFTDLGRTQNFVTKIMQVLKPERLGAIVYENIKMQFSIKIFKTFSIFDFRHDGVCELGENFVMLHRKTNSK